MATTARKTRQPVKPLNIDAEVVRIQAAQEQSRKRQSRKALHAAKAEPVKPATPAEPTPAEIEARAARKAAEREAYLQTLREDAAALGRDPDEYIAEQLTEAPKEGKYHGPMLTLRTAAKTYTKGKNGNPHCNDELAIALDGLTREQVVTVLIAAMKLDGNPYLHLNPGQQSMNLRNKARGQLKNGFIKLADIAEARRLHAPN